MAASRLAFYKQQLYSSDSCEDDDITKELDRALKDAKLARKLWLTWWKAHFRVGQVYVVLEEHEKAIDSFERAFALDPTKIEIQTALDESRIIVHRNSRQEYLDPRTNWKTIPENLNDLKEKFGLDPEMMRKNRNLLKLIDPSAADVMKGHQFALGDIDVIQDYEQAAKYFAKAANAGNAEGMYNLARLLDKGLGVKKDHNLAREWLEKAAAQPPEHPIVKGLPNIGVAESEHALGVRYFEGISVRKDLSLAVYWYQRATDHGSAMAANNLGSMYLDGLAVDKDLEKADQLHELAAKRGDPVAMMTLAEIRLSKNDFQMARLWYDRACESGNVVARRDRDKFIKTLEARQRCSPDVLKAMKTAENYLLSCQSKYSASVASEHLYLKDYEMLCDYARRGSITAKKLRTALEHYTQALNILISFETLTEEQENIFVHELSQCYRIETIVAQIPSHMHKKVSNIIERVLFRCTKESKSITSQLDEDVRFCFATLNINSYGLVEQFLEICKQKYPKSIYFYLISGAVHGFRRQSDTGLYNINHGLEIEPNNYTLLYHKAILLRHIGKDMNEAIKAYEKFITIAPKDHRKIPEAYYEMAQCYMKDYRPDVAMDWIFKRYKEGKEAEKLQLPCFLPYKSENIAFIQPFVDMMESTINNVEPEPINNRKKHLTDPYRIELIKNHREWEKTTLDEKRNPAYKSISTTVKPRVKQQTDKSLIGLKSITLREMDPRKDYVYTGRVLSVTIIEETFSWIPSIHLVIEDENFDCQRMLIYGISEEQGEYLIKKSYTVGKKIHIINPYLRIGKVDMKPSIRVDDISSIVMQSESEWILNMCRYCCEANASKFCGKCEQARYCSKECQTNDWKLYKHKLICKN
ncbi:hypothetical protein I4U23_027145 [Adineta vaga]|nr:hypothetical protein I4U23_027145 [Adineta vaga]